MARRVTAALLDTSILIAAGSTLEEVPASSAISVVTLGELHAGIHLARTDQIRRLRQGRLDAVRRAFIPIPVDEPIAERFGEVLALARREKRTVKATDVLIVATALSTARALATLDEAQANLARAAGAVLA